MEELLAHPAVQAGAAPFLASLAAAAILRRRVALHPIVIGLAFLVVIGLTVGFSFEPLTSTRKLVIVGSAAVAVALGLQLSRRNITRTTEFAVAIAAGAAAIWMVWRVLAQAELSAAWLQGGAVFAFAAAVVCVATRPVVDGITAAAESTALGVGTGVLALLGASAFLAQIGIALAAGAAALLLVQLIASRTSNPIVPTLPAAVISACVILLAIFTGSLRWFCALPMLALPWAASLPRGISNPWTRACAVIACSAVPVLISVALARSAGLGFALE